MSSNDSDPGPPDYAHAHDRQAERTRYELWVILAVVVVVIVGALVWRAVTHSPAAPQAGWNRTSPSAAAPTSAATAPAAVGVASHGVISAPAPRPATAP